MKLQPLCRTILSLLEFRARLPFSDIARELKISDQLVRYHIKQAEKQNFILGYNAVIDLALIGYSWHMVYARFFGLSTQDEKNWFNRTMRTKGVALISNSIGPWDAMFAIVSQSTAELNAQISSICQGVSGNIAGMSVTTEVECHYSSLKIIGSADPLVKSTREFSEPLKIDDVDKQILKILARDCRVSTRQIGESLSLTPSSVQRRINRLQDENVIIGFHAQYDYEALGYTQFRVFFRLTDTSMETFRKIKREVLRTGYAESVSRYLGYADLDLRCYARSLSELSQRLGAIRDRFVHEIVQIEIAPLFSWKSLNYMPIE